MSNSVSTQGQAILVLAALQKLLLNINGTYAEQVSDVSNFFTLILGSTSPGITPSQASQVIYAFRAASFGNSDVPSQTQAYVNTIGSALLAASVNSTVAQAQLVFERVWRSKRDISGEPAHQIQSANNLITALLAL